MPKPGPRSVVDNTALVTIEVPLWKKHLYRNIDKMINEARNNGGDLFTHIHIQSNGDVLHQVADFNRKLAALFTDSPS